MSITRKKVSELKPHPRNEEIYGNNESIDDLVATMRKSGLVTTLTITDDNVIIAGHRRWKSCKQLIQEGDKRFCEVTCEIRKFDNEWEELEYLVINNDTREKSMEQKAREAKALIKAEQELAKKRKLATQNNKTAKEIKQELADVAELPPQLNTGKTRDIVAKKLHMKSGREVERVVKAIQKIDELQEQGRIEDSQLIKNTLNSTSASTAEELANRIDQLTEDEKQAIRDKKMSAYKAVSKYAAKRTDKKADKMSAEKQAELAHKQACKEAVEEYIAQSMGLIDIPDVPVDDRTDDLIAFFNTSVGTLTAAITNLLSNVSKFSEAQRNKVFGIIKNADYKLNEIKNLMEE